MKKLFSLLVLMLGSMVFSQVETVSLEWDANVEQDLVGYDIYRSETAGVGYVKLNQNLFSGATYIDNTVQIGKTYYYVVTASNTSGLESGYSNEVSTFVQNPNSPLPPTGLEVIVNIGDFTLDASRRIDWTVSGYPGNIPDVVTNIVNAQTAGAAGDGVTDDAAAIQAAIDGASVPGVIYFPAATYHIESQLTLKSGIVLRGEGSEQTILEFESDTGCLGAAGVLGGSRIAITSGLAKGSTSLVVADVADFDVGGGGEIRQDDFAIPDAEWGSEYVGQMVNIVAINGTTLTIDPPLHIDLIAVENPTIAPVDFVEEIGVEDMEILRTDSENVSSSIVFDRMRNSWFRRLEVNFTQKYHFDLVRCLNLEIRDSYIHDCQTKGNGGAGYGVNLGRYVTSVLVENNIFSELRHAMVAQIGTNGCVFGYNYAERNYSDDTLNKTYLTTHGHYPFMNLFEGNIVGWLTISDYWGQSGPGNTIFRNRMIGTDGYQNFGDLRGIDIDDYSHEQNVVGNELIGSSTDILFDGDPDPENGTSDGVLVHGNNVHGTITWDAGEPDHALPDSFYLSGKPDFFGSLDWPSLGSDMVLGLGTIPALLRNNSANYVPQPNDPFPPHSP